MDGAIIIGTVLSPPRALDLCVLIGAPPIIKFRNGHSEFLRSPGGYIKNQSTGLQKRACCRPIMALAPRRVLSGSLARTGRLSTALHRDGRPASRFCAPRCVALVAGYDYNTPVPRSPPVKDFFVRTHSGIQADHGLAFESIVHNRLSLICRSSSVTFPSSARCGRVPELVHGRQPSSIASSEWLDSVLWILSVLASLAAAYKSCVAYAS